MIIICFYHVQLLVYFFRLLYENYVGGVLAMTGEQIKITGGYNTDFYGWGGEDDDIYLR